MAKVTVKEPNPPVPPRPEGVTVELSWDEALLLHALVGRSVSSQVLETVEQYAKSYTFQSGRPASHLRLGRETPELLSLYDALHDVYMGKKN